MNKWFERAILINLILFAAYVLVDYILWIGIAPTFQLVFSNDLQGVVIKGDYTFFSRILAINGYTRAGASLPMIYNATSFNPNFPLFLFIVAIIVNVVLVYKATKK